jgi:hypothetical protein
MALARDTRNRTVLSWRRVAARDEGLSLSRVSALVIGVQCALFSTRYIFHGAQYFPRTWVRALTTSLVKSTIKLPKNFLMTRSL